jgi:hypothetical protein
MHAYDVVIIGDVSGTYFSQRQLELIRRHVGVTGAGLLWIAGSAHTPRSYEATELAPLLPMRHPGAVAPLRLPDTGLTPTPSPWAGARGLLRLRSQDDDAAPAWPKQLLALRWVQDMGALKPAAEVLLEAVGAQTPVPVVATMRYGAGHVTYVATDETWRWRYGAGELYFDQVWLQMVRMLGRGRIQQDNRRVRLSVSSRRVDVRQAVVVSLETDDPLLAGDDLKRVRLDVRCADNSDSAVVERIELYPVAQDTEEGAVGAKRYQTTWRPAQAGRLVLQVAEPTMADLDITCRLEVVWPDDELRHGRPDHQRLTLLAGKTGGKVIRADQFDQLATLVRDDRKKTDYPQGESLWDSYLALFAVVLLLTVEWVGRKIIRLA